MANTSDFKNGLCIEFNNDLYTIVQFQHVKPGKGPAFVRTKLKNLRTGRVIDNTFNSGVKINTPNVERRPYQYLYKDDNGFNFMHTETFEQITINPDMIENSDLMKEGQKVEVVYHVDTDTPLTCELPPFVVLEITYSEPGIKGDTSSTTAMKSATLETGTSINVPLFINQGDKIKVDTRTRAYVERVKE
ncbi:MAG: elongation factor P [Bacteroidota bacterium]|nr:elongation factor P [Bacteroidota bacterium]MDP4226159.1 elongation factor P [Bacteroidota bacterium]MDP4274422.1 elongation factor P [Bacteroidota bacterium]